MAELVTITNRPYDVGLRIAANILEYFDADSQKDALKDLRNEVNRYSEAEDKINCLRDISRDFKLRSMAIENRPQEEGQEEVVVDRTEAREQLAKEFDRAVENIKPNTSNNKNRKDFNRQLDQLIGALASSRTANDTDDDLQMTGEVNVICPISKVRMVEPVKNEYCGHTYDKNSVLEMIKQNARTRCPVMGCSNQEFLRPEHLSVDIVTKIYMERNF